MRKVTCPECGREIEVSTESRAGEIIDCPFWAGLSLRLREVGSQLMAAIVHKASCPVCERDIILSDGAKPGDTIRCCDTEFRLTFVFGAFALE